MSENETKQAPKEHKVIIIGAGMAGLSAANHLIKNGVDDFRILEARNRIGGRIVSIDIGTQKVDFSTIPNVCVIRNYIIFIYCFLQIELGANWIHGVLGNPMFEIAMANGLVNILNAPKPHKLIASTEDGKQVPFPVLHEIYEAYVCFLKRCEEYFLCQYLPPPDIESVGEHINYEIELYLASQADSEDKLLKKMIFDCLLKRETCITGCNNMNEIDLLELGSYTELQGGNIVLPSGYSSILVPIQQAIQPEQIVLSCPVKSIHWKRKKATVQRESSLGGLEVVDEECDSDDSDKTVTDVPIQRTDRLKNGDKVRIVCDDGSEYYANHVICTMPLGVLKECHKTMFDPELPDYKLESIEHLLFGTVDKIFLEYDRPFLNADISEVMLLWDSHDETDKSIENTWYRKIYSFSKVSDTLLLGWISGREAEYMETLSHNVVADVCTDILRKFLKDPFIPKPKSCVW